MASDSIKGRQAGAHRRAGTRPAAPYLYIGGPKEFLTQKVLVGLDDMLKLEEA